MQASSTAPSQVSGPRRRLVGASFGRLTVIGRSGKDRQGAHLWLCRCACGVEKAIRGYCLARGDTKSCGCLNRDGTLNSQRRHGLSFTPIHRAWSSMRQRCQNQRDGGYKNYGGRGIRVCSRWQSFDMFLADMGPTHRPGLTLDRIDVNGNYEPGNCRWATVQEQLNNTRVNRFLEIDGQRKTLTQWARHFGLRRTRVVFDRIRRGWLPRDAVSTPTRAYS